MFCSSCGQQLPAGVRFCTKCGHAVSGEAPPPPPPSAPPPPQYVSPSPPPPPMYGAGANAYGQAPAAPVGPPPTYNLVGGVLVTIFCCLIGGLISIIYGSQVSSKWAAGDYVGAHAALRTANGWKTASIVVSLIIWLLGLAAALLPALLQR